MHQDEIYTIFDFENLCNFICALFDLIELKNVKAK